MNPEPAHPASDGTAAGRGVLMVWTDFPADQQDEFEEWYNRRHVPDRVPGVPGFDLAVRYLNTGSGPRYLAYYETRHPDVLQSSAYLELVRNRDPQTEQILPRFQNTIRTVGTISGEFRLGYGCCLLLIPITPAPGSEDRLRRTILEDLIPMTGSREGVVRAALVERNAAALGSSAQLHVRKNDRSLDWVLLIDGTGSRLRQTVGDEHREAIAASGGVMGDIATFQAISFVPASSR